MSNDTRNCNQCGKEYEYGFMGAGTRFCSRKCRTIKNSNRSLALYHRLRKNISCLVCGRDIQMVGKRKHIYRYCSTKCMQLHNRIKRGQKTVTVKIPVKVVVMKPVTIYVKDIPLIFTHRILQ